MTIFRPLIIAAVMATPLPALGAPEAYGSPEEAVAAVLSALEARDRAALIATFGAENEDVVLSGDPERDRADWRSFMTAYRALHRLAEQEDGSVRLYVGRDQWPFPISLIQGADGWVFDAATAREEIVIRRIGRNELDVIDLMKGYVGVQADYRQIDYDGDGVMEFASQIISDAGTRNGLYWPADTDAPPSPIGDFVARASATGYSLEGRDVAPEPYLGYYFHVLAEQGPNAPGGAMPYAVNGNMVAGHALLAFPAAYGETGVMSFMVGENGIVLEANLGEQTLEIADAITSFDPDDAWTAVVPLIE